MTPPAQRKKKPGQKLKRGEVTDRLYTLVASGLMEGHTREDILREYGKEYGKAALEGARRRMGRLIETEKTLWEPVMPAWPVAMFGGLGMVFVTTDKKGIRNAAVKHKEKEEEKLKEGKIEGRPKNAEPTISTPRSSANNATDSQSIYSQEMVIDTIFEETKSWNKLEKGMVCIADALIIHGIEHDFVLFCFFQELQSFLMYIRSVVQIVEHVVQTQTGFVAHSDVERRVRERLEKQEAIPHRKAGLLGKKGKTSEEGEGELEEGV